MRTVYVVSGRFAQDPSETDAAATKLQRLENEAVRQNLDILIWLQIYLSHVQHFNGGVTIFKLPLMPDLFCLRLWDRCSRLAGPRIHHVLLDLHQRRPHPVPHLALMALYQRRQHHPLPHLAMASALKDAR